MFTQTLYTNIQGIIIHNSQKMDTTQMPSVDEWINKIWYIHTMEYYPSM